MPKAIKAADAFLRLFERIGAWITTALLLAGGLTAAVAFLHHKHVTAWVPVVVGVPLLLLVFVLVAYALSIHSTPSAEAGDVVADGASEYEKELIVNALESIQQAIGTSTFWDIDALVGSGILGAARGLLIGSAHEDVRLAVLVPADDPPTTFRMRWSAGHRPESVAKYERAIDEVLAGAAFRRGEVIDRPDVENDPDFRRNPRATRGFASLYALPLRIDEDIVGVLSVVSTVAGAFSASDIAFIKIIAALIDVVLAVEHDGSRLSQAYADLGTALGISGDEEEPAGA